MSDRTQYFRKFPFVEYNGYTSINIMKRTDINQNVKNYLSVYYSHTLSHDDTLEKIAHDYYDDVDLDWLIYHANDIIDPQYEKSLSDVEFEAFIKKKYGSIENAINTTVYYKNDYNSDTRVLSTEGYNALPGEQRKYWQPEFGFLGNIAGYSRSQEDFTASTNKYISFSFSTEMDTPFAKDDRIYYTSDASVKATVSFANTSYCVIKHVWGSWEKETDFEVTSYTDGSTANIDSTTVTTLQDVIPLQEQVYYSHVTAYDVEETKNDSLREVNLIDKAYVKKLNKNLTDLLR